MVDHEEAAREALRARLAAAGSVEPWSVVAQRWADVLMGWMP